MGGGGGGGGEGVGRGDERGLSSLCPHGTGAITQMMANEATAAAAPQGLLLLAPSLGVLSASQAARALGIGAAGLTVFIRSFRQLALLSALGICCSVAVLVAVCACSLFDLDRSHAAVPPSQARRHPTHP